jgi:hypothetical protein
VAVDAGGNVYVAANAQVRKIWHSNPSAPPKLTVAAAASQPALAQHAINLQLTCDKPCAFTASGTIAVGGAVLALGRSGGNQAGTACPAAVSVRLPAQTQSRLEQLLKPNAVARATITLRAADLNKHTVTITRQVSVKR